MKIQTQHFSFRKIGKTLFMLRILTVLITVNLKPGYKGTLKEYLRVINIDNIFDTQR